MKKTIQGSMPPIVPRWRSIRNAFKAVHDPNPFLAQNVQDYGKTYAFHVGGVRKGIMTMDPGFIQHVLQRNHRNYRKSPLLTDILAHYAGNGLLTADGAFWLRQRRLIQPAFHRNKLDKLTVIVQDEIDRFFEAEWKSGERRPIFADMHRLAFRIVAKALFSTAMDDRQIVELSKKITAVQSFVVKRIRQPYLHYWFYANGDRKKYDRITNEIREILRNVIQDRQAESAEYGDLLDLLLSSRYEDTGEPMEGDQILDESLIMFTAGHETSANALTWTLFLLAQHPEYLEIMRSADLSMDKPSLGAVFKHQHTRQAIEESMRLYPPAWIVDRISNNEDSYGEYAFPKDTFFILWIYGLHRDPDIWEQPLTFDPSRFDEERAKERPPFSYIPFGGGPRLCIGNQFAMMEMIMAINHAVDRFDLNFESDHPTTQPLITLRPGEEMYARIDARRPLS